MLGLRVGVADSVLGSDRVLLKDRELVASCESVIDLETVADLISEKLSVFPVRETLELWLLVPRDLVEEAALSEKLPDREAVCSLDML